MCWGCGSSLVMREVVRVHGIVSDRGEEEKGGGVSVGVLEKVLEDAGCRLRWVVKV